MHGGLVVDHGRARAMQSSSRVIHAGVFLGVFGWSLRHLYPAFRLDDSPETIAAALQLGVQHMPGYPVITLLGRVAAALPVGGPVFRVNLLAAVLAAACAVMIHRCVARLFPSRAGAVAGVAAAFWFSVTGPAQDMALAAKGAVYGFNLLVTLRLLHGVIAGADWTTLALWSGLGLADHWMSLVCWLPVLACSNVSWNPRRAALTAGFILLGVSLYLQLPLSAMREPVWGDPATARGFVAILFRTDLLPQATARPASTAALQAGWNALAPLRAGGLPWVILGLAGLAGLWRHRPRTATALAIGGGLTIAAVAAGANPIHHRTGELVLWFTEPFLLPWLGAFAVAAGAGLLVVRQAVPARWQAGFQAAVLIWPLLLAARTAAEHDHAADYLGWDAGRNVVAGLPHPCVLLAEADFATWPALALLDALDPSEERRLIITTPYMERSWGWRRAARRWPPARFAPGGEQAFQPDQGERLARWIDATSPGWPVWYLGVSASPVIAGRQRLIGLAGPILPRGAPVVSIDARETVRWFSRARLRGLYGDSPAKDRLTLVTLDQYGLARARPAEAARARDKITEAAAGYRAASALPGLFVRAQTLRNLGLACGLLGDDAGAAEAFASAARLRPGNADLWANAGIAFQRLGRTADARTWLTAALRIDPNHAAARHALASLP